MADVMNSTARLLSSYKKWMTGNPQLLSDIENTFRYLSYFAAGRFNDSSFASELIYSMPNLLVLFNDLLMYGEKLVHFKLSKAESKLKVWLTVLEYTETIFEVTAQKFWGETGKWIVITFVQVLKAIMRLLLVYLCKERMTKSPPLAPLDRDKFNESQEEKLQLKEGFALKRSGMFVRSVKACGPIGTRTWIPPYRDENQNLSDTHISERNTMLAETLYIVKPLVHLGCMSVTGQKHWQPWFLSFAIDLLSLKLLSENAKACSLRKEEEKELLRRRISLVLYLLRSPFYEKYSHQRILRILDAFSRNVPLARIVAEPLKKYLPHWQSMYFYMWSC